MYFDWYIFKTIIALGNLFLGLRNLYDLHYRHFNQIIGFLNLLFGVIGLILWSHSFEQFRLWGWFLMGGCVLLELVTSVIYISINHYEIEKLRRKLQKLRKYVE